MPRFDIWEADMRFATVTADDAEKALDEAEQDYPRHRSDYNLDPDDAPFEIEWTAHDADEVLPSARRMVAVPSEEGDES